MAQITLWGATYSDVPAVDLPATGGGTARFYDAVDGDELEYGTEVLSDLTGTTWYIDAAPTLYNTIDMIFLLNNIEITSTSNNSSHTRLVPANYATVNGLYYDDVMNNNPVYTPSGGWVDEAYRTIIITGGAGATNADLIAWIQANATQQ